MVGDEANGPRLERSIRRRGRGRRIHSVCVGGGCSSELHRVQTWGEWIAEGRGSRDADAVSCGGVSRAGGSSAVRLGRARGDVASSEEGAEASAASEGADGRPLRPMTEIICRGLQLELRANPRCRALGSHAGGGGACSSKSSRLREPSSSPRSSPRPSTPLHFDPCITIPMESIRPALASLRVGAPRRVARPLYQCLHTTASRRATPLPHPSVPGPPPETPVPSASDALDRVARKRKQAALLQQAKEVRAAPNRPTSALAKRFWKSVSVKDTEGKALLFWSSLDRCSREQMVCRYTSTTDPSEHLPKKSSPSPPRSIRSPRRLRLNGICF